MFIMFVNEQSHLFDDQVSNFFFIGQKLFLAYLQVVVFSLKIDKRLRQCRDWFSEDFIKGIPVIGIDPALKIEEREEQIVDAFFNTHHNSFLDSGPLPREAAPSDAPTRLALQQRMPARFDI